MVTTPFVFSSCNLPKLKAKQLAKAFPHLKLSTAQEATAQALGYSSWYECTHRGAHGHPSPSDQDAGLATRVCRYNHQANVLIGIGITPSEADLWVRTWGLTGHPTLAPEFGMPLYVSWNNALEQFERGEITEAQLLGDFGAHEDSDYPEIDSPKRICPGVILGPLGKYPHYVIDPAIAAQIPIYLRGPHSNYHYEDDADLLAMSVPRMQASRQNEHTAPLLNRIHHEWHFGSKHPSTTAEVVPKLIAAAIARPNELVVVSARWMPADGGYDPERIALACLRGSAFAAFLNRKGELEPSAVIWFRDVEPPHVLIEWSTWLDGLGTHSEFPPLPVFQDAAKHQPGLPLYSYPFMSAPMSADEYSGITERLSLLPLDEDYSAD